MWSDVVVVVTPEGRVEGRDDLGTASGQTIARGLAQGPRRQIHGPGLLADHRPARADRGPPDPRQLWNEAGPWPPNDLIKGAFNRCPVGTLVERKTRFVVLCKMAGHTAAAALEDFSRQMKRLPPEVRPPEIRPPEIRKSITLDQVRGRLCDRGSEVACHPKLAQRLKIASRIGRPAPPRPPGANEKTNGSRRCN